MAKKVIGIVPSASLFQQEDPYLDQILGADVIQGLTLHHYQLNGAWRN